MKAAIAATVLLFLNVVAPASANAQESDLYFSNVKIENALEISARDYRNGEWNGEPAYRVLFEGGLGGWIIPVCQEGKCIALNMIAELQFAEASELNEQSALELVNRYNTGLNYGKIIYANDKLFMQQYVIAGDAVSQPTVAENVALFGFMAGGVTDAMIKELRN